jgi:hypothetical protein
VTITVLTKTTTSSLEVMTVSKSITDVSNTQHDMNGETDDTVSQSKLPQVTRIESRI